MRSLFRFLLASSLILILACDGSDPAPEPGAGGTGGGGGSSRVAELEVTPLSMVIGVAEERLISVVALDDQGEPVDVSVYFVSSDPEIALVSADGMVAGRAKGRTTIEVEAGGKRAVIAVTVEARAALLELPGPFVIPVGESRKLEVVLQDEEGNDLDQSRIIWGSTDPRIARVREGQLWAMGWGEAMVTASVGTLEESIDVRTLLRFDEIGLGSGHTCGRTPMKEVYCWGRGEQGELGFSSEEEITSAPTRPVGEGMLFEALAVGTSHACALDAEGAAHCWGRNDENQLGEVRVASSPEPIAIPGLPPLKALSARGSQTCGLSEEGDAYCWGGRAVPVEAVRGRGFVQVAAGAEHVCGLAEGGQVHCWGLNGSGQLGLPPEELGESEEPVLVETPVLKSLRSGYDHVCGIGQDGSLVTCWGSNQHGELGRGEGSEWELPDRTTNGFPFRSLALGAGLSCGLSDGAGAYCWGANGWGQTGSGLEDPALPEPARVVSGDWTFAKVGAGMRHACALTEGGEAYCWGDNSDGQLGVPDCGQDEVCPTPELVIGQR